MTDSINVFVSESPQRNHVKGQLFEALVQLLDEKDLDAVTVSELCTRAGVSRMSFYRCFSAKEDILKSYLDELFAAYLKGVMRSGELSVSAFASGFFAYWRGNGAFVQMLIRCDLAALLLKKFDQYLGILFTTMLHVDTGRDVSRYEIAYHAGGLYQVLVEWARADFEGSNDQMADVVVALTKDYSVHKPVRRR